MMSKLLRKMALRLLWLRISRLESDRKALDKEIIRLRRIHAEECNRLNEPCEEEYTA